MGINAGGKYKDQGTQRDSFDDWVDRIEQSKFYTLIRWIAYFSLFIIIARVLQYLLRSF